MKAFIAFNFKTMMHRIRPKEVKKAMKYFIFEGMLSKISGLLFSSFFMPFLVFISLTNFQIGLISTIMYASLVIAKIPGIFIVRGRHKSATIVSATIFRVGIMLLPVIAYFSHRSFFPIALLVSIMYFANEISGLSFSVWFNSLIPKKYKNRYRNKRSSIMKMAALPIMLIVSAFIKGHESMLSYFLVFLIAGMAGLGSSYLLSKIPYKKMRSRKKLRIPSHVIPFLAYEGIFKFGVGLTASFVAVYFIRYLHKDVTWVVLMSFFAELAAFFTFKSQETGKIADMNGSRAGLILGTLGAALLPVLFLISFNYPLLIISAVIDGVIWASLQTFRFDYIVRTARDVDSAFAFADTVRNLSLALGSFVGGVVASASVFGMQGIIILFLLSSAVRLGAFIACTKVPKIRGEMSVGQIIKDKMESLMP